MTMQLQSPQSAGDVASSLAAWRSLYPRLREMIDSGTHPFLAFRSMGLALWQDGRTEDAARMLEAAIALAPNHSGLLAELGCLHHATGRHSEALRALNASLALDPQQPQAWLVLANLHRQNGNAELAERAFRAALSLEPGSPNATAGLGLLYCELRRFEDAARFLAAAIAKGASGPAVYGCLGEALQHLGKHADAAAALGIAARDLPDCAPIVRKYAQARLVQLAISASVDVAMAAYLEIGGAHAENIDAACRAAFQTLCVYGPPEAAMRVGESILARSPDDPIITHHLDALRGKSPTRVPGRYLTACFDRFAERFDQHLVEVLRYRIPEEANQLLAQTGRHYARMLDLGCGTGLAAPHLSKLGQSLIGVDISPRMLEKARRRNLYSRLVEDDALTFLQQTDERFDLIAAFDMIIYFGDLVELFAAAAARLAIGSVFAFSFETGQDRDYRLLPSGRFAHTPAYVESVYRRNFTVIDQVETAVRLEAGRPVAGELVLLRRA